MRTAPGLQRVLGTALEDGGWFDAGHEQAVREVATREDPEERVRERARSSPRRRAWG